MSDTFDKLLIIGLGNPILTDDAIGWRVAHALRERLRGRGREEKRQDPSPPSHGSPPRSPSVAAPIVAQRFSRSFRRASAAA